MEFEEALKVYEDCFGENYFFYMGFTKTVPDEQIKSDGKHVTISNTGKYDCFVRVKAFAPVSLGYKADKNWSKGADDYWYYSDILPAGQTRATGITIKYFRQERKRKRNSTSNTHSRQ